MRTDELALLYLTLGAVAALVQRRRHVARAEVSDHSAGPLVARGLGEGLSMVLLWPLLLPFELGRAEVGDDGLGPLLDKARACPMGLLLPTPRAMQELHRRAAALRASLLQVRRLEEGLQAATSEGAPLQSLLKLRAKTEQELLLIEQFLLRVRFYAELLLLEELTPEPSVAGEIEALMASFTFLEEASEEST